MASKLLSSVAGGSGSFKQSFASGALQISLGVSGNIAVLTPPSGEVVRLTGLQAQSVEAGISITAGSKTVVASLDLGTATTDVGEFIIGYPTNAGYGSSDKGFIPYIEGGIDEVITIIKDTGNTLANMRYSYQFGK